MAARFVKSKLSFESSVEEKKGKSKKSKDKDNIIPHVKTAKNGLEEKELKSSTRLVQFSVHTRKLVINKDATDLLRAIRQPVAVLGICGPYRSGKSYFMSRLMGSNDFKVSHSMNPCTKGIWLSTSTKELEHCTMVALDTEGIGAAQASEASSKEEVMKYLIITTLLSSCLIYNAKGAIEESHLQQMSCFGQLSQSILISESYKNNDQHESCIRKHFPDFVWLIRDRDLEFEDDDGDEISATDYLLQKVLVMNNAGKMPLSTRDRTVNSIKTNFPKIECMHITNPGAGLSNPKKRQFIDPEFFSQMDRVIKHIVSNIRVKHTGFNASTPIDGPMLASLLEHYVAALNKPEAVPNLEVSYWTAVDTTIKNSITKMAEEYSNQMSTLVDAHLPMEEGDWEAVEHSHTSRIEEASQRVLEAVELPLSVDKSDTLLQIHEMVFNHYLSILTVELHKLIPDMSTSDNAAKSEPQQRKKKFLLDYKYLLIKATLGKVTGGRASNFIEHNYKKSNNTCKELFEEFYKRQVEVGETSLQKLKTDYYEVAKGPAKNAVFKCLYSKIPGPPEEITITDQNQIVTVFWKKPTIHPDTATRYEVQWYKEGNNKKGDTIYSGYEHKLPNLMPKTTYFVKVRGINISGNGSRLGEYSEELKLKTKAWRPDRPEMVTIVPENNVAVKLEVTMLPESKENGSPVTHIHIYRRSDACSEWTSQAFPVDSTNGDYQFLTLGTHFASNEKTMFFQVQFENEAGLSEASKSIRLDIEEMIPGKPENIQTHSKAREIQITWEPPKTNTGAVKSYHIQYWEKNLNKKLTSRADKVTNHIDHSLLIDALAPKTEYEIRMYASNANHKYSQHSTVTVETLAAVPDKPQLHTIKVLTATKVRLSFCRQKPSEENGSKVYAAVIEQRVQTETESTTKWTELGKEFPIEADQDNSLNVDLEFELTSLTSKSTRCYRVRTVNSVPGRSDPSRAVELHPENIIPGEPDQLQASDIKSGSMKITWEPPRNNSLVVDKYRIQYKSTSEGTWITKEMDSVTIANHCTVSDLRPNTGYSFTVQAMNGVLFSEKSCLYVKTPSSVRPKPRSLIAIPRGHTFTIKMVLPAVEESGSEVTRLHVHHYNYMKDQTPFKTEHFEIDLNKIKAETRHYEQKIEVNIDKTRWISVSLSNEMGKGEESDLIGLSFGDVTPGIPASLTAKVESRRVHLSWKVPQTNGNAAKYYEVLIKQNGKWNIQEGIMIHQKRSKETLSYHATVHDLHSFKLYQFAVQAVNNTTRNVLVGERAIIEVRTSKSPPDKPFYPTVELLDEGRAEVMITLLSEDKMNGSNVHKVILYCNDEEVIQINILEEEQTRDTLTKTVTLPNFVDPNITMYCFQVQMVNEVGESELSDSYPFLVSQLKPGPPVEPKITGVSAHSIRVSWQTPDLNPALVTQYLLEYYQVGLEMYQNEVNTVDNEYDIPGLQSGRKHRIKVIAIATRANRSKAAEVVQSTQEIYPGPPISLYVDKVGRNSVKIRWRKPSKNPLEVVFYFIELRKGDITAAKDVEKTKRTMGYSTVLKELEPNTKYTVSVSTCNDNKKRCEDSIVHKEFRTKMSRAMKHVLQAATVPTVAGPFILGYSQSPDENMDESDEEYPASSSAYPGAPQDLTITHLYGYFFKIEWKPPEQNSEELWYYNVSVLSKKSAKHFKCYYPQRKLKHMFEPDTKYTVSVTSIKYHDAGQEDPEGSSISLTKVVNNHHWQRVEDLLSL